MLCPGDQCIKFSSVQERKLYKLEPREYLSKGYAIPQDFKSPPYNLSYDFKVKNVWECLTCHLKWFEDFEGDLIVAWMEPEVYIPYNHNKGLKRGLSR